jgi:hypothetical protein
MSSKAIKAALVSELSLKASQVSVRRDGCAYRVQVSLTDKVVPMSAINAIAQRWESVSRCEATGDILEGGNTYVTCQYNRVSSDLCTLLWFIQDTALEVCPMGVHWREAANHLGSTMEQLVAENDYGFKCGKGDLMNLARSFPSEATDKYL